MSVKQCVISVNTSFWKFYMLVVYCLLLRLPYLTLCYFWGEQPSCLVLKLCHLLIWFLSVNNYVTYYGICFVVQCVKLVVWLVWEVCSILLLFVHVLHIMSFDANHSVADRWAKSRASLLSLVKGETFQDIPAEENTQIAALRILKCHSKIVADEEYLVKLTLSCSRLNVDQNYVVLLQKSKMKLWWVSNHLFIIDLLLIFYQLA